MRGCKQLPIQICKNLPLEFNDKIAWLIIQFVWNSVFAGVNQHVTLTTAAL